MKSLRDAVKREMANRHPPCQVCALPPKQRREVEASRLEDGATFPEISAALKRELNIAATPEALGHHFQRHVKTNG